MDEDTKRALQRIATGYTYEDKVVIAKADGVPREIRVSKKHVPPSVEAIKLIEQLKLAGKW